MEQDEVHSARWRQRPAAAVTCGDGGGDVCFASDLGSSDDCCAIHAVKFNLLREMMGIMIAMIEVVMVVMVMIV